MQSNLTINTISPAFQAKVSLNFKDAAKNYFSDFDKSTAKMKHFEKCSNRFYRYEYDKFVIDFETKIADGKKQFVLFAHDGNRKVILSTKDQFRKIVEKFMHMSQFEFGAKMSKK